MRKRIVILILLAALFPAFLLENAGVFSDLKSSLRDRDLPSPLLNFGRRGQIMRELGLRYVVPVDEEGRSTDSSGKSSRMSLDLSKLSYGKNWTSVSEMDPEKMPSTRLAGKDEVKSGVPLISLYAAHDDLFDEYTGIYTNYLKRGRNWERPCFVSYFNEGKLLFGSGAGIRLHGGTSRRHPLKSFRIYLRPMYGREKFGDRLLFEGHGDPVSHLIIRKADPGYGFILSLAFDISRKLGCIAPWSEPARFYLNGRPHGHGNFELIEHLSKEFLASHFGHNKFIFVRIKGRKDRPPEYRDLSEWARLSDKITFDDAASRIDMENFTKYWIANIFCANSDPYQGLALLDKTAKNAKWFWVMWDMDHSFRNIYEKEKKHLWQQERPVNFVVTNEKRETDPRYFIFRKLIFSDAEYREYFKQRFIKSINHLLTEKFLRERVDHYGNISGSFKMAAEKNTPLLHDFMKNRRDFAVQMMARLFSFGDVKRVNLVNSPNLPVVVDGIRYGGPYRGLYYKGMTVTLSSGAGPVKGWNVNGKTIWSRRLTLPVDDDMKIVPLR